MAKQLSKYECAIDHALAEADRIGDPSTLSLPIRTIVLVHSAQGIIDNGGLQYFFEADFPGNPPYSIFVAAYRDIGAQNEAGALANAVKLFPFPEPHLHQNLRAKFLEQFLDEGCLKPDSPFEKFTDQLCGNMKVWRLLKEYVLKNSSAFPL